MELNTKLWMILHTKSVFMPALFQNIEIEIFWYNCSDGPGSSIQNKHVHVDVVCNDYYS